MSTLYQETATLYQVMLKVNLELSGYQCIKILMFLVFTLFILKFNGDFGSEIVCAFLFLNLVV